MLSISSIFSAISGGVGAARKAPEANTAASSIASHSETLDDVVSLSSRGLKAAQNAGSTAANTTGIRAAPDEAPQAVSKPRQTDRAVTLQAVRIATEARQQIATRQQDPAPPATQPSLQKDMSHASNATSSEARRAVSAYQASRDIFSLVAQHASFRASA